VSTPSASPAHQPPTTQSLAWPEIAAIAAIALIWGVNNAASKVATDVLPPLLMGGLRFAIAGVFLVWFVRPPFPNLKSLALLVLFGGPIHFGLVYLGFWMAQDLSPYSVALQLWIPFTALFAFLLLGEHLSRLAIAGLLVAFAGVAFMTLDPHAVRDWAAIAVGIAASAAWALTTVIARRTTKVAPLKMQGLLALVAAPSLLLGSWLFESAQGEAIAAATPLVWASVLWAALVSTVVATGLLFWLVQRREAGRVTPYLLSTPLITIAIGWAFMGDILTPQILIGAALTMAGVGVVSLAERGLRAGAVRS
jgi:O-acetylserine/cysteine efflux transporter